MEGSFGEALLHQFHTPEKQIIVQLEEVANLPYILNNRTKQKDGWELMDFYFALRITEY